MHTKKTLFYDRWTVVFAVLGSLNILNALWMLIAPEHWYHNLPAGVPEFGPLNIHFIRDLGCVFFLLGCGLLIGGFYLIQLRLVLFTINTLFYISHMFVHIHEIVSGRLRLGIFWIDLPGIYMPTLVICILNIILMKQHMNSSNVRRFQIQLEHNVRVDDNL